MVVGTAPPGSEQASKAQSRRALVAGSVGNFIEWYEFGVYGFLATIIATNFFSAEGGSDLEALIKTYASFALAFFFRPDRAAAVRPARRPDRAAAHAHPGGAADVGGHALIGLLPTYASIGLAAPLLLTRSGSCRGCRRVVSSGSGLGDDRVRPPGRRGLYGSWQSFTVALGLLAGAGVSRSWPRR